MMASPIFLIVWPKEPADAGPQLREFDPATDNPQERFTQAVASGRFRRVALAHQFQGAGA